MGIISSAIDFGGAVLNVASQKKLNQQMMDFERDEAYNQRVWSEKQTAAQNAWNYEMWQKQNEYNSPVAQVERMRDAGLNPLFYGLDGSSAGSLTAAQPLGYDRASAPNLGNPISAGVDAAVKIAQVSNIQADTAKKNNENLTETQKREKIIADIEEVRQDVKLKLAQTDLTEVERKKLEKDLSWLDRLNEATLNEKKSAAALSDAQKKRIEELLENEKVIQSKTIEDFDYKWKKIEAEIDKIAGENAILAQDLANYALNHANNGFMGTGLSLTNLIRALRGGKRNSKERDIPDDIQDLINSGQ